MIPTHTLPIKNLQQLRSLRGIEGLTSNRAVTLCRSPFELVQTSGFQFDFIELLSSAVGVEASGILAQGDVDVVEIVRIRVFLQNSIKMRTSTSWRVKIYLLL